MQKATVAVESRAERLVRAALLKTVHPGYLAARRLVSSILMDRRFGLDTAREVELAALHLDREDRVDYEPSRWRTLRRILPPREVSPADVFIDFGSGKGRVVFQAAAHYPFRRVIGVELSEALNVVARANIERNRHRLRCQDVELVTSDVMDYVIPDDVTIAYFNNPFRGAIFASVIERLLASFDRQPRALRVVYSNPREEEYLLGTGRFEVLRTVRARRLGREWSRRRSTHLYRVR